MFVQKSLERIKIICVATLIFISSACSPLAFKSALKGKLAGDFITQSLSYRNSFDLVILPVIIEEETFHFIYDTGAQTTVISSKIANLVKLKHKGEIIITDSQKMQQKLKVGNIPIIKIGEEEYKNVGALINDFGNQDQFSCMKVDGILGMNIIKLHNWSIDYDNKTISFLPKDTPLEKRNAIPVPIKMNRNIPYMELFIDNVQERFLIDIGNNGEKIDVPKRFKMSKTENRLYGISSFGLFGAGKADTIRYSYANLEDDYGFIHDSIVIEKTNMNAFNIGNGFFQKFYSEVSFDFNRYKMILKKRTSADNTIYEFPIKAKISENGLLIGATEQAVKQPEVSDVVYSINGRISTPYNKCELIDEMWNAMKEKKELLIEIDKNGKIEKYSFQVKSILQP